MCSLEPVGASSRGGVVGEVGMVKVGNKSRLARRCLAWGMCILISYVSMRSFVYASFPLEQHAWVMRDTFMNIPRLLCTFALLAACAYYWGLRATGLTFAEPIKGIGYGLCFIGVWFLNHLIGEAFYDYDPGYLLILTVSSFIVALFEELLFRGLFLKALAELWGERVGLWGSAFLFTVYHIQAQPLEAWGMLFLAGAYLALMRLAGVGLWWCIFTHGLFDSLVFVGTHGEAIYPWMPPVLLGLEGLVVIWVCRHVGQCRSAEGAQFQ